MRGALPVGDDWREYVSAGAERAYDGPLSESRQEAEILTKKGRVVAAHKREKASYKIRVRGYDRKNRGEKPVEKAYSSKTIAVGPVKYATKNLRLRKPTKGEERAEQLRAVLGGVGTVKLAAGAGAGALITDAAKDAQARSKKAAASVKDKLSTTEESKMTKSFSELEHRVTVASIVTDAPQRIVKADSVDLVDISKGPVGWIKAGAGKALGKVTSPITEPLKKKAKKYALIGAGGIAGATAVGTAAGNTVSPRR